MNFCRLLVAATLATLAACNGDAPQEGEVTGEVLEGTISDEMLPLDRVQSEAPLADPTAARNTGGSADEADEAEAADDVEPVAEDAPATEPAEAED